MLRRTCYCCLILVAMHAHISVIGQQTVAQPERGTSNDVVVSGTVQSQNSVGITNRTFSKATLIFVTPDKSRVKEGELIFEFDDSTLQQNREEHRILLRQSQAQVAAAEAAIRSLEEKSSSQSELAALELKLAKLNQERLLGKSGKLAIETNAVLQSLQVVEAKRNRLKTEIENAKRKDLDFEDLQFEQETAQVKIERLKSQLNYLQGPEKEYHGARLELKFIKAKFKNQTLEMDYKVQRTTAEAELESARVELGLMQDQFEHLELQINACQVYAPQDGFLLHQNICRENDFGFLVEEGALVVDRQTIAIIPDMARLQAEVLVAESQVDLLKTGQVAKLKIERSPDRIFTGQVIRVNSYADRQPVEVAPRYYRVFVSILDAPTEIELGASAKITILTGKQ